MLTRKNYTLELDAKNYIRMKFKTKGLNPALVKILPKYKSTGIRLSKKDHFNYDKAEIYKKEKGADLLNEMLQQRVGEILASFKVEVREEEQMEGSFLKFYKGIVDEQKNYSTRVKQQSCYNTFEKFLNSKGLKDVSYSDITIQLIREFDTYLTTTPNQYKRLNEATTISKVLGVTRHIVNLAQERGQHYYKVHPYLGVKLIETHGKKDRLSQDELTTLLGIDKSIRANLKLDIEQGIKRYNYYFHITRAKNCFLLMLFMNGMRVHDFMTIKFSNFKWIEGNLELHYNTSKKGYKMEIIVPAKAFPCMWVFVGKELRKFGYDKELPYSELKESYEKTQDPNSFKNIIHLMSQISEYKNRLMFSFREEDNEIFKNYRADVKIDEMEKRLHSITAQYNSHLKDLQDFAGIKTKLTTHVSRHSLAQLMAQSDSNMSVFEIMAVLGHKKLSTTDNYIKALKQSDVSHKVSNVLDKL